MSRDAIIQALESLRSAPTSEKELQSWMDGAFSRAGILFDREVETGAGPVDFVIGTIAVEVKTKGSPVVITRQLLRYLRTGRFTEIILVTTKAINLPPTLETASGAIPVTVVPLWKQFL